MNPGVKFYERFFHSKIFIFTVKQNNLTLHAWGTHFYFTGAPFWQSVQWHLMVTSLFLWQDDLGYLAHWARRLPRFWLHRLLVERHHALLDRFRWRRRLPWFRLYRCLHRRFHWFVHPRWRGWYRFLTLHQRYSVHRPLDLRYHCLVTPGFCWCHLLGELVCEGEEFIVGELELVDEMPIRLDGGCDSRWHLMTFRIAEDISRINHMGSYKYILIKIIMPLKSNPRVSFKLITPYYRP